MSATSSTRWVDCAIIRGGTSKGVFFLESDLPADREERDRLLLRAFGSPDPRQIDGLGGADPLTSKCVIVSPGDDDFDLYYTFVQISIDQPHADYGSVCGNLSSALGHYALWKGLVSADGETTSKMRVNVTNVGGWIEVETPVADGLARNDGNFSIPGVPGTGAEVVVNLAGLAGTRLGSVFPTGARSEKLEVDELGTVEVTLMDVGNPHVFVRAGDVGLTGLETAAELDSDPSLLDRLESLRGAAAHRLGMATSPDRARAETPAAPILGLVAPPADYTTDQGERVDAQSYDIAARLQFMQRTHKNYAGTSTACTGAAVRIAGTVPASCSPDIRDGAAVRIGHPNGVIETHSAISESPDGAVAVDRATVSRTARILMTGQVAIPS